MFSRSKGSALWKPKRLHSLAYLRYLYSVLQKNSTVNEQNSDTVVEAVRLIAEILIWGDQNDNTVMDFFLEKNILEYFFKVIKQNPTRAVCVQILQTLNILFENISNKTAVYYLLSNNHTNEIITHRFDFSDEEVVAYYISFLKTLSLRLDSHTINFFYLEQRREFDLYVEAIKLFCHPESMVRIAVRTITLNIHRVKDEGALEFIHHQTSVPYFSYLVWSVGNTALDIDDLLRPDLSTQNRSKLEDLLAEHIDHLHYVNDLLSLGIEGINEVLCDQLLHRLLIPLYVYSLTKRHKTSLHEATSVQRPHVTRSVATFLLTHVFVILQHVDIVRVLTESIFLGDPSLTDMVPWTNISDADNPQPGNKCVFISDCPGDAGESIDIEDNYGSSQFDPVLSIAENLIAATKCIRSARIAPAGSRLEAYVRFSNGSFRRPQFSQPRQPLEVSLRNSKGVTSALLRSIWPTSLSPLNLNARRLSTPPVASDTDHLSRSDRSDTLRNSGAPSASPQNSTTSDTNEPAIDPTADQEFGSSCLSSGDREIHLTKSTLPVASSYSPNSSLLKTTENQSCQSQADSDRPCELQGRPFLRALFRALEVGPGTDCVTLLTLLLFICIQVNTGVDQSTLRLARLSEPIPCGCSPYDNLLVNKLLDLVSDACKSGSRVRLITLQLAIRLLTELVCDSKKRCYLSDPHFAQIVSAREEAMMVLRSYFQNNAIFLDLFENELYQIQKPLVSPLKLALDPTLLIPQVTPTSGSSASVAASGVAHCEYWRRLPHSDVEHTQRAIGVFLLLHVWLESLLRARPNEHQDETLPDATLHEVLESPSLPAPLFSTNLFVDLAAIPGIAGLANIPDPRSSAQAHRAGDKLDLSSEALIGCTVESEGSYEKRFLVNYSQQLVLVEPDSRQMGWGVITFIGPLQDMDATCDPADSRCLHVAIGAPVHPTSLLKKPSGLSKPTNDPRGSGAKPLLAARFLFEDHIRCMTARQMLIRGREWARQAKLRKVAALIDFSAQFLHETFAFPSATATEYSPSCVFDSREPTKFNADEPTSRTLAVSGSGRMANNRNPGVFLMERQSHRAKIQQRFQAGESIADARLPWNGPCAADHSYTVQGIRSQRPSCSSQQSHNRLIDFVPRAPVSLVRQCVSPQLKLPSLQYLSGESSEPNTSNPVHSIGPSATTGAITKNEADPGANNR